MLNQVCTFVLNVLFISSLKKIAAFQKICNDSLSPLMFEGFKTTTENFEHLIDSLSKEDAQVSYLVYAFRHTQSWYYHDNRTRISTINMFH